MTPGGAPSSSEWQQWWDIDATALYCHERGFRRVGLQFPDSLLSDAPKVVQRVQAAVDGLTTASNGHRCQLYLMADTSYNPACVDEVAAAHMNAEAVVHYGPACMCPTSRLPTRFVFGRRAVDVVALSSKLADHITSLRLDAASPPAAAVIVFLAHSCIHCREEMQDAVHAQLAAGVPGGGDSRETVEGLKLEFAQLVGRELEPAQDSDGCRAVDEAACGSSGYDGSSYQMAGFRWSVPQGTTMDDCAAVWVGEADNGAAFHLQMSFSAARWACLSLSEDGQEATLLDGLPPAVSKLLGRRYFLMEKAREASIVGLLVGTLGVAGYGRATSQLRRLIEEAGKACYVFLVGKPSPAKLANFPEIEVFVQVGCPQGLVLDSKEYYAPVITPHEAVLAFTGQDWNAPSYRLDFSAVLDPSVAEAVQDQEPRLSFISGGRTLLGTSSAFMSDPALVGEDEATEGEETGALGLPHGGQLVERKEDMAISELKSSGALQVASAAEFMQYRRTYRGLETPATGATLKPVEMAVPGLSGRAAVYESEPGGQQQGQK